MSPGNVGPLSILIVDDHAIVREGLRRILETHASHWRIIEAPDGVSGLAALREDASVDLAIVDLTMPGMNGLDFLRRALVQLPKLRLLVLSLHADEQYAMRAFKAGAHGYATKDASTQDIVKAVQRVAAGSAYVSSNLAERLVLQINGTLKMPSHARLSDRELDIVRRLVNGERPSRIAVALHLSVKTVSTHKGRILDKLNLPNTAALIRYGLEHGLGLDDRRLLDRDNDLGDGVAAMPVPDGDDSTALGIPHISARRPGDGGLPRRRRDDPA